MTNDKKTIISAIEKFLKNKENNEFKFNDGAIVCVELWCTPTQTKLIRLFWSDEPEREEEKVMLESQPIDTTKPIDIDSLSYFSYEECLSIYHTLLRQLHIAEEKNITKHLKENDLYVDSITLDYDSKVLIQIDWGDWKHDHLRLRHLMSQLGYMLVSEKVTEEDGSDCYSALHTYTTANPLTLN